MRTVCRLCKFLPMGLVVLLAIFGVVGAVIVVLDGRGKAAKSGDKYEIKEAAKDAASGFGGAVYGVIVLIFVLLGYWAIYNLSQ